MPSAIADEYAALKDPNGFLGELSDELTAPDGVGKYWQYQCGSIAESVKNVAPGKIITPSPSDERAGWSHLIHPTLQPEYLVLLGIPLSATFADKAVKD
jgi:hypothetical protein